MKDNTVLLDVGECRWAKLSKTQAEKQIAYFLDDQSLIWHARRIGDDLETLETCTFTSLRDAAYWLLLNNDAIYNAGVTLMDGILLAEQLGLLYSAGENPYAPELPRYIQCFNASIVL